MKEFKNYRLFAAGLLIVVLALYGVNTTPVQGDSTKEVIVVNTNANPLPVSGTVTGTVTGSVSITGTPTVNVGNTPTVNLGAGNTVGLTGPVLVGNTASSPVLVRDVENPGRSAFQREVTCFSAIQNCTTSFTVPSGHRLIIEYISANFILPLGTEGRLALDTTVSGVLAIHALQVSRQITFPNEFEFFTASTPTRIYADGGSVVHVFAERNGLGPLDPQSLTMNMSFSGTLVECGVGPGCSLP